MRRAALVIGKPAVGVRDCLVDVFCIVLAFDEWRENFCSDGRRNFLHTGRFSRSFWNFLRKVWARAQKRGIIENARGGLYAQNREKPKEETVQDKRFALNSPLRKTLAGVCAVLVFCGICYAAYNLTFWLRNRRIVNTYGPGGARRPLCRRSRWKTIAQATRSPFTEKMAIPFMWSRRAPSACFPAGWHGWKLPIAIGSIMIPTRSKAPI